MDTTKNNELIIHKKQVAFLIVFYIVTLISALIAGYIIGYRSCSRDVIDQYKKETLADEVYSSILLSEQAGQTGYEINTESPDQIKQTTE